MLTDQNEKVSQYLEFENRYFKQYHNTGIVFNTDKITQVLDTDSHLLKGRYPEKAWFLNDIVFPLLKSIVINIDNVRLQITNPLFRISGLLDLENHKPVITFVFTPNQDNGYDSILGFNESGFDITITPDSIIIKKGKEKYAVYSDSVFIFEFRGFIMGFLRHYFDVKKSYDFNQTLIKHDIPQEMLIDETGYAFPSTGYFESVRVNMEGYTVTGEF